MQIKLLIFTLIYYLEYLYLYMYLTNMQKH